MNYNFIAHTLGLTQNTLTSLDLVKVARNGIPKQAINSLANCLHITLSELIKYLHVSERTLKRYASNKLLSSVLSDQLLQIAKVYVKSLEVFEDEEDASNWIKQPNTALGNTAPIELFDTSAGIELILDELTRIEHGVIA